ncbi:invasion associated locus B family protein [Roseomonas sp. BN140053]|uniref:invasion associated locus B family protein n=1 Tax=Roseomonas sp. BN140053 TaxID=3391898 RepID=UPI0039E9AEFC
MKRLLPVLAALVPFAALAQPARNAAAPQRLGSFGNWTAATHQEGGGKVCYAFTRATKSEGGGTRQGVMLTVTHRPQGRDQVAAALGYTLRRENDRADTQVEGEIGTNEIRFYGAQTNAFAQNGAQAVGFFRNGRELVVKGPGPQGGGARGATTDTFSLSGFTAAYEAISRECPARR